MAKAKERKKHLKKRWSRFARFFVKAVISPLIGAIILTIVVSNVADLWRGPDYYHIYVVGDSAETFVKDIRDKLKESIKGKDLRIDGVKADIKYLDDQGKPDRAQEISSELAKAKDTLMVVGHFLSTQTKEALPNYLEADPPIPVILTTETNPNVFQDETMTNVEEGRYPVYRLSPTDDEQAISAAEYAISKGATVFWVVEDISNRDYTHYLAAKFIERVQEKGEAVVLWSTILNIPFEEIYEELNINCVFFAGKWSNALILIRQIKALSSGKKMPIIILSDWAAEQNLIKQGKDDVEKVYLTHPLGAGQGYALYGEYAFKIIKILIDEANNKFKEKMREKGRVSYWLKRLLDMHRVKDTRYVLNSTMKKFKGDEYPYCYEPYEFKINDKEYYVFQKDGTRENAKFHVWQIKNGQFTEAEGNVND